MRLLFIYLTYVKFSFSSTSFLHSTIEDDVETEISDWSDVKIDGLVRNINFIIGVDSSLTRFYNYDEERIKSATITLIHTINEYFYQLNIRLSIVDILPVKGTSMGLDDLISWKKEQKQFVDHDVLVLLRHNYEGGIAFQDGMCTNNSLIISGFFPESTMNNAWVLIHQLAHVFGLTHKIRTKCECKKGDAAKCLKLRGFPTCSVQEMMKLLPRKKCLINKSLHQIGALPICGNGILENGEDCDCGPEKYCDNILCEATKCKFVMEKSWLSFLITFVFSLIAFLFLLALWKCVFLQIGQTIISKMSNASSAENDIEREIQKTTLNPSCSTISTSAGLDLPDTVVKMRAPIVVDRPDQDDPNRRKTRFSDIYMPMRPISRFWEKFRAQNPNGSVAAAAAPI